MATDAEGRPLPVSDKVSVAHRPKALIERERIRRTWLDPSGTHALALVTSGSASASRSTRCRL
jgi:hypothetical protein